MKNLLIVATLLLGAMAAQAQGTEEYELVCPYDGGQIFIGLSKKEVALRPNIQGGDLFPMVTVDYQLARCPDCMTIDFRADLAEGYPLMRATVTASLVQTGDGQTTPGNHKLTLSLQEDGEWQVLEKDISCNLNEPY